MIELSSALDPDGLTILQRADAIALAYPIRHVGNANDSLAIPFSPLERLREAINSRPSHIFEPHYVAEDPWGHHCPDAVLLAGDCGNNNSR